MSTVGGNDGDLHYEDGSHRWTGGDGTPRSEQLWRVRIEAHKEAHRAEDRGGNARRWPGHLQQSRRFDDLSQ